MADSIAVSILKAVKSKKGRSFEDLELVLPERYRLTDAGPGEYLCEPLRRLLKWDLIQAYDGRRLIDGAEIKGMKPHEFRYYRWHYYLSPLAATMEETLGFSFTGGPAAIFGSPLERKDRPWPDLFVLMPFAVDLKPVFDDHIKPVASNLGLVAARADDFFSTDSIISEIWSAICHANVVLADCTGRNPNVFYETGIAHTIGKDTILISQSIEDVPFDLRYLRVILYSFTPRGMKKFEEALSKILGGSRRRARRR